TPPAALRAREIATLAIEHRLITFAPNSAMVRAGLLISLGPRGADTTRRAAAIVVKNPERRQARRYPSRATNYIRAGRQSQNSECARPYRAAMDPRPRRRGHRIRRVVAKR